MDWWKCTRSGGLLKFFDYFLFSQDIDGGNGIQASFSNSIREKIVFSVCMRYSKRLKHLYEATSAMMAYCIYNGSLKRVIYSALRWYCVTCILLTMLSRTSSNKTRSLVRGNEYSFLRRWRAVNGFCQKGNKFCLVTSCMLKQLLCRWSWLLSLGGVLNKLITVKELCLWLDRLTALSNLSLHSWGPAVPSSSIHSSSFFCAEICTRWDC